MPPFFVRMLPLLLACCTNAQLLSSMSQTPEPSLPTSPPDTLRIASTPARADFERLPNSDFKRP